MSNLDNISIDNNSSGLSSTTFKKQNKKNKIKIVLTLNLKI